jgi:hypothetical protein
MENSEENIHADEERRRAGLAALFFPDSLFHQDQQGLYFINGVVRFSPKDSFGM